VSKDALAAYPNGVNAKPIEVVDARTLERCGYHRRSLSQSHTVTVRHGIPNSKTQGARRRHVIFPMLLNIPMYTAGHDSPRK
jgi:hypothetical protein